MTADVPTPERQKKERWSYSWKHLYDEVVTIGLCTGCAGCVIACPHDVLGYDDTGGKYKPIQIEDYGGPADCSHGDKACTSCTRACPRFRAWEPEIDKFMFGRAREPDEVSGVYQGHLPRPRERPRAARGRPGRRPRLGDARVRARARPHRRRARLLPRGRRHARGRRSPASRATATTSSRRPGAATRTRPTRSRTKTSRRKTSASRSSACRASRRSRR